MVRDVIVDEESGRKCYLDHPSDLADGEQVTFLLNLHGGGSAGAVAAGVLPRLRVRRRATAW